ncbi:MAG: hypothetical protein KDB82_10545 [Planctomycetes bacterium]|nr:hypothetical protein [Planctomycetota bacterium]
MTNGLHVMRIVLFFLVCAPLYACCPVDKNDLGTEAPDVSVLANIAGVIERNPPAYWEAELAEAERMEMTDFQRAVRSAVALDQLDRQEAALDLLKAWQGEALKPEQKVRLKQLRMQAAMDLWWRGGSAGYSQAECLRIAREANDGADAALMGKVLDWAERAEKADPERYLPDFFDLRYATDKTVDHDTGELANRGLGGAEEFLLRQIRRHPAWENFDSFYALNLLYVVSGRQNLAYYTRLRCWQLHADGKFSRVPGADAIADIKPLTILRQFRAGVMVPVKVVSDENQQLADAYFKAQQAYAVDWRKARNQYFAQQQAAGIALDDPGFWTGFTPPNTNFPPLKLNTVAPDNPAPKPEPAPSIAPKANTEDAPEEAGKRESSRTVTWITLGILAGVLLLCVLAKSRIGGATESAPEEDDKDEPRDEA